jgi:cholesterol transport system auxiliary component
MTPMKKTLRLLLSVLIAFNGALLAGCATTGQSDPLYDLGMLRNVQSAQPAALPALPPVSIAEIRSPSWLDNTLMFYRLSYANDQQPRPYASSRWAMPPAQLLAQRLKSRIAQAGGAALPAADGAVNVPVLRIEADDFTQVFETPGQSVAQVALRAALFNGRALVAQKNFVKQVPAPSADAAGGARALAIASDAVITDMMMWLSALPPAAR